MALRFSTRAHTADRIPWRPWGEEAFALAAAEGKPILLSISAVWCHWCHVMDETTYSDPAVQERIAADFIPVRVDTDLRPDVNARYNMGGWPTTAFLTARGEVLTGATYLPPREMLRALAEVSRRYRQEREEFEALPLRQPSLPAATLPELKAVEEAIWSQRDEVHGGFGVAPKFPHPAALRHFLEVEAERPGRFGSHLTETLQRMRHGELWDQVAGGFFRYATEADWARPHTEKILLDQAELLYIYARAATVLPAMATLGRETAALLWRYVEGTLAHGRLFGGSQDADEDYYRLPAEERAGRPAPRVDETLYVDANARLAWALLMAGALLGEEAWWRRGADLLTATAETFLGDEGLRHTPAGELTDYLPDLVAFGRAAWAGDLLGVRGADGWLAFAAEAVADRQDPDSGLFRDLATPGPGRLQVGSVELGEQAEAALLLLMADGEGRYREAARSALAAVGGLAVAHGALAAPYAEALRALEAPPLLLAPGDGLTASLRSAMVRLPQPLKVRGHDAVPPGTVVACLGTVCAAPARDGDELLANVARLQPEARNRLVGRAERVVVGRVPEGEDLLAFLTEAARRHGVRMGVIGAIGSVSRAVLWYLDQRERRYREIVLERPLEIAAAMGNVSLRDGEPFCHVHITLGDEDGRAFAGHLAPGTVVFTAEYWIQEIEGEPLVRSHDPHFNLPLWGGPAGRR